MCIQTHPVEAASITTQGRSYVQPFEPNEIQVSRQQFKIIYCHLIPVLAAHKTRLFSYFFPFAICKILSPDQINSSAALNMNRMP